MLPSSRPLALLALACAAAACGGDDPVEPTPQPGAATLSGAISADRTLSRDTVYTLGGYVRVQPGVTLTIQPGTRIQGDPTNRNTGLFVLAGAYLVANGTATQPIVFTSGVAQGSRAPGDWGGLTIVGRAPVSRPGPIFTEGVDETRIDYNPTGSQRDANDSSGVLRYVRVEFAGTAPVQGSELNSISMYGVGRGTRLEYVQAHAGLDDSFEWFGGSVDGRYLVSTESGDDHFDWTQGYNGRNQFLVAVQTRRLVARAGAGDLGSDPQGFEGDGCEAECPQGFNTEPFAQPVFANFTLIGPGANVVPSAGGLGARIRRGTGGTFVNGVIARWPNRAITIEDAATNTRRTAGLLTIQNVVFAGNTANYDPAGGAAFFQQANFQNAGLVEAASLDGVFAGLPTNTTASVASLDFVVPVGGSAPASTGLGTFPAAITERVANFRYGTLTGTSYAGAAAPGGERWWQGWTAYPLN
jgi:hypothetical protein